MHGMAKDRRQMGLERARSVRIEPAARNPELGGEVELAAPSAANAASLR